MRPRTPPRSPSHKKREHSRRREEAAGRRGDLLDCFAALAMTVDDDKFLDPIEARKKAMDYLARREHGRGELLDKLTRFGFDADVADDAVAQLIDDGLQSDSRFAEAFVRSRINQGKGPVRIRTELRDRGLAGSAIDLALEEADEDWYALAREVRLKKFGPDTPREFRDKAKQMRFLQSRGFEPDQIQAAVSADPD